MDFLTNLDGTGHSNRNGFRLPFFEGVNLRATFNLLNSSTMVAFSGALRVYIAFLLLGVDVSLLSCLAGGLVVYTVYTLDRALDCEEDSVNRSDLCGARRDIALLVSMIAFFIGTYILFRQGLYFVSFIPFVIGFLYSKGLKVGNFNLKLKGGLGMKNIVVGLTWGGFITGVVSGSINSAIPLLFIFIFFGFKLFINSAIYDFKDIKGDALAGIKTLPVSFGEKRTRYLLLGMHTISHIGLMAAVMNGFLAFEPVILLYSFIAGVICILFYTIPQESETKDKKMARTFLVDGESTSIVGLKAAMAPVLSCLHLLPF